MKPLTVLWTLSVVAVDGSTWLVSFSALDPTVGSIVIIGGLC